MPPDSAFRAAGEEESALDSDDFEIQSDVANFINDFVPHFATYGEIIGISVSNASNLQEVLAESSPKLGAATIESSPSLSKPPNPQKFHEPANGGSQNPTGLVDDSVSSGSRSSNLPAT